MGYSTPADLTDVMDLIITIVAVFKSSQIHRISIQEMLGALLKDHKTTIKEAGDRKSSQQAIFTAGSRHWSSQPWIIQLIILVPLPLPDSPPQSRRKAP